MRHPLYLGNFFMWLGIALLCCNWWLAVVFTLAFWLYYERIMFTEEEFLRRKFGDEYLAWAQRTPAFVPNPRLWRRAERPFSLRKALRGEYCGLFGLVTAFLAMETLEHAVVEKEFIIEPQWGLIFLVGLAAFLVLRFLKKHTTVLKVPAA